MHLGTAFAVRPDGVFLTAAHVVKDARIVTVKCPGKLPDAATVLSTAYALDVAVIQGRQPTPVYLPLAKVRSIRIGERIFSVGFPAPALLGPGTKFTDGAVSSLSGPGGEAAIMQITVPLQPGNSGGPVLNESGEVIGIVVSTAAVMPFLAGTGALPQNVNFAIKSEFALPLFEAPQTRATAISRQKAIDNAVEATCLIEASA